MKANAESCEHDFRAHEVQAPGYCPRCDAWLVPGEDELWSWAIRLEGLEREAGEAGDAEQAALCADALYGNPVAFEKCKAVIREATERANAEAWEPVETADEARHREALDRVARCPPTSRARARVIRDWFREGGPCPDGVDAELAERVYQDAVSAGFSPGSASVETIRKLYQEARDRKLVAELVRTRLTGTEVTA